MSPDQAEAREAVRAVIREALDREADWSALADAGLLSLAVPEAHGGEGLGLAEVARAAPRDRRPGACTCRSGRRSAAGH